MTLMTNCLNSFIVEEQPIKNLQLIITSVLLTKQNSGLEAEIFTETSHRQPDSRCFSQLMLGSASDVVPPRWFWFWFCSAGPEEEADGGPSQGGSDRDGEGCEVWWWWRQRWCGLQDGAMVCGGGGDLWLVAHDSLCVCELRQKVLHCN